MPSQRNKWLVGAVSAATLSGAMLWEGKSNVPYTPVPGDERTVCYGETNVTMRRYTDDECIALLKTDLVSYGNGVLQCINVPITQNEHAGFTLFAYNEGVYRFCHSSISAKLNSGRHLSACRAIATKDDGSPAFSTSGGHYYQGLQNRRQYESKLCMEGLS